MGFPKMPPVTLLRRLPMFNDGVPHRVRFWSIVLIAFCYQFAGGGYLASLSQMVGELSCLDEDVTMGGYCSLIGLNMIFPMLFKWKFHFYTRQMFFVPSVAIILCSILACFAKEPWMFWIICLIAGYAKMMGMFSCMSNVQLNFTPTRNFAVFFPIIYVIVCGSIQLSGLVTAYVSYFSNWRMMNLVVMGLMLLVDAWVYFFMKHDHRPGPPVSLEGVDWLGQALWIGVSVTAAWVFTFGEHYDWWESCEIWYGTLATLILIVAILLHSLRMEHPYISLHAFTYLNTYKLLFLLIGMSVLSAGAHVLQPTYLGGVLHYDTLQIISLNYPELAGVVMGAILGYFVLVRWKWGIKRYLFLMFGMAVYYVMSMYFLCDTATDKETMYLGLFALGVSEVMIEIIATYYLSQTIPFPHFFMNIAIIGLVRCGVGSAAGAALLHRFFKLSMTKSVMILSERITDPQQLGAASEWLGTQSLLMALKESYGFLISVGLFILWTLLLFNYQMTIRRLVPKMISVRKWMMRLEDGDPTIPAKAG